MNIQKHLNAREPNLSKFGHRQYALLAAVVVSALSSFVPLEQGQAQLLIHVYPSQDSPTNQTLWIFSGSSTASRNSRIRSSGIADSGDTWRVNRNLFNANEPNFPGVTFPLSPFFSSSNTNDIDSVRARIPGGGKTNITFAASATNTPTITIGSGSRTIANLWMWNDGNEDRLGIRISGSNLSYSPGNSSAWVGAGILNKPIGDFHTGTFNRGRSFPTFAAANTGSIRVTVNSQVIPEPQEYALIFGLFALAFVFFHRRFLQKHTAVRG